ncbi:hypothetical protein DFH09DRAFT_1325120 [Mycena vulgaris]|nr:hypothetical protein DFH09DRAFT_1325120 [Mycena vulgaris]
MSEGCGGNHPARKLSSSRSRQSIFLSLRSRYRQAARPAGSADLLGLRMSRIEPPASTSINPGAELDLGKMSISPAHCATATARSRIWEMRTLDAPPLDN